MGKLRESQEAHNAHLAHSLKKQRMAGKFWYSKQQRRDSDKKGYPQFFCMVEGEIKEYTQMVDVEALAEDPFDRCMYEDAEYLGEGFFSHRKKM